MNTNTKQLRLAQLKIQTAFQLRVELNAAAVTDYAEAMLAGEQFPPIKVVNHNATYILADGFHRVEAARQAGKAAILAEIIEGDEATALEIAVKANRQHGLRMTSADKRRAIKLVLSKWPQKSNREIARLVGCTDPTVGTVRREVQEFCIPLAPAAGLSDADSTRFAQLEAILKHEQNRAGFMRVSSVMLTMRRLDPDAFPGLCEENGIKPEMVALVEELFGQRVI
jgi:ParB-like chromosome segregation protein Spo0J